MSNVAGIVEVEDISRVENLHCFRVPVPDVINCLPDKADLLLTHLDM
jgi:hypothetical protein